MLRSFSLNFIKLIVFEYLVIKLSPSHWAM